MIRIRRAWSELCTGLVVHCQPVKTTDEWRQRSASILTLKMSQNFMSTARVRYPLVQLCVQFTVVKAQVQAVYRHACHFQLLNFHRPL